ncbi:MAG: hypothetical protein KAH84_10700 [Thiomargarita sp.]|nr:hypothetical protein [Thiomargarita sp.]
MQTYHFDEIVVNNNGVVTLSGLPPLTKVAIVVTEPNSLDWQIRMKKLMQDVSENHPFAKMSREDILEHLRQTREEVYDELYGDRNVG